MITMSIDERVVRGKKQDERRAVVMRKTFMVN